MKGYCNNDSSMNQCFLKLSIYYVQSYWDISNIITHPPPTYTHTLFHIIYPPTVDYILILKSTFLYMQHQVHTHTHTHTHIHTHTNTYTHTDSNVYCCSTTYYTLESNSTMKLKRTLLYVQLWRYYIIELKQQHTKWY